MFSGYNKDGQGGARVGNWVEELALQDMTGSTRYEVCNIGHCCDKYRSIPTKSIAD
jgi:hypothetical protein